MVEKDLATLTISEVAPKIRDGEVSPVALTKLYLERIERLNPLLSAYLTPTTESALEEADAAEKEIRSGSYRGPLHGIPVSIKDNFATRGVRTTAGAKALSDWIPDFDATVVTRLREAGAISLGKTNMHEWAKGSHGVNPFYGTPSNPWDTNRIPGGSSSGSAVAVAAGMCMATVGTDAAGSVRNPASLCGIVGLKPTYGRVSVFGGVPGTGGYSTNHFGPLTRTVADCAAMMQVIAGHDPQDPLSSREPVPDYSASLGAPVDGMRVGVIKGYFERWASNEVMQAFSDALDLLRSLGDDRGGGRGSPHGPGPRGAALRQPGGEHSGCRVLPAEPRQGLQPQHAVHADPGADGIGRDVQPVPAHPPAHLRRLRRGPGAGGRDPVAHLAGAGDFHRRVHERFRDGGRPQAAAPGSGRKLPDAVHHPPTTSAGCRR